MENYTVEFAKGDCVPNCYYGTLIFYNPDNNSKVSEFSFDIEEIKNPNDNFKQYSKLNLTDKKNIFIKFIDLIKQNISSELYFIMENGEKSIKFISTEQIIIFSLSSMCTGIEFRIKNLIDKFIEQLEKILLS